MSQSGNEKHLNNNNKRNNNEELGNGKQREHNGNNNINQQQEENKEEGNNRNKCSDEGTNPREELRRRHNNQGNDFYSDELDMCGEETLRLVGININNIPESGTSPKNQQIFQAINESGAGIVGITEVGRCWHLLPEKDRWTERVKGWWENSKSTIAYNTKDVAPS